MGRILNLKERLYWEIWDTDFSGTGNLGVNAQRTLFSGNRVGNTHLTNMQVSGQLASANTAAVLALGYTTVFYTLKQASVTVVARTTVVSQSAADVQWNRETQELFLNQCLLTFNIDVKPVWTGLVRQAPAGHGSWGDLSVSSAGASGQSDIGNLFQSNGEPTPDALLRFAKPIIISCQQAFSVTATNAVQNVMGANGVAALNALDYLNSANPTVGSDYKFGCVHLYTLLLRDVL